MEDKRPKHGTPEFDEWLTKRMKKRAKEIFSVEIPEEIAEKVGCGMMTAPVHINDLVPEKTIAEDIAIDKEIARSHLEVVPKKKKK